MVVHILRLFNSVLHELDWGRRYYILLFAIYRLTIGYLVASPGRFSFTFLGLREGLYLFCRSLQTEKISFSFEVKFYFQTCRLVKKKRSTKKVEY